MPGLIHPGTCAASGEGFWEALFRRTAVRGAASASRLRSAQGEMTVREGA